MKPHAIVDPELRFDGLRGRLAADGWQLVDCTAQPILPGEPEHAVFERAPQGRLVYTFNPVCGLRVLDLSGAGAMAPELPMADAAQVRRWLASDNERTVLRGILAAGVLADPGLVDAVQAHLAHPRRALAQAAARVVPPLRALAPGTEGDAQGQALAFVEALKLQLAPLLQALPQDAAGELTASLKPQPEDAARAFLGPAAALARQASTADWAREPPPRVAPVAAGSELLIYLAPAGMLADENLLSRGFPGGYRQLSPLLDPHRVWVRWKYVRAGQRGGMAYDGLVWLDDHWAWFPRPYRMLAPLLAPPH